MLPLATIQNLGSVAFTNIKPLSKSSDIKFFATPYIQRSKINHIIFGKPCRPYTATSCLPSLPYLVSIVFCICAHKKMIRIDAAGVIASMANLSSNWDFTYVDLEGKTVRRDHLPANSNLPIALLFPCSIPYPATWRDPHLAEKTVNKIHVIFPIGYQG